MVALLSLPLMEKAWLEEGGAGVGLRLNQGRTARNRLRRFGIHFNPRSCRARAPEAPLVGL